ncbi:MAG: hypothetical protein QGG40_08685 [Myxococcota bacterium]|nr:hypothetical protein [Myxococcota bacterium]
MAVLVGSVVASMGCGGGSDSDKAFLTSQQDILAGALQPSSSAAFQVWAFTSVQGQGWIRSERPVAHSYTSLGLHLEEGELHLSGQHRLQLPTAEEEAMNLLWTQSLVTDGTDWSARITPFEDPEVTSHTDHQWHAGELWYFATAQSHRAFDQPVDQDPANLPVERDPLWREGMHLLRSTSPARTRVEGAGLGDPSPVTFQGQLHLFATRVHGTISQGSVEVVHFAGPDLTEARTFPGVTVPFAAVVGEELWLLAQAQVGGRRQPVGARSRDGTTWSSWEPLVDLGTMSNCTSPVMGKLGETWWLFCVEETRQPG